MSARALIRALVEFDGVFDERNVVFDGAAAAVAVVVEPLLKEGGERVVRNYTQCSMNIDKHARECFDGSVCRRVQCAHEIIRRVSARERGRERACRRVRYGIGLRLHERERHVLSSWKEGGAAWVSPSSIVPQVHR